ncbi:Glyoxalase superfamily enzyme, possibly 3-demethylubiquinone-9 3-methyltransferase [Hymenobacter gelipurpurascens]|uniref:Glyoxalase superfamily enzyme, possibly 3-demethylubiquinone-9 3-methyltransferase n=1 Tax=Hymenobacter gelipurpurascens TaxID=89968 RepID=A0A212UDV4_9BACT|nr:VOC family protein [Hymenobacter gelipurpurascens]SNC76425.1 Glyoxalase superfamily enzyme, possibly 3-demethylubiquinone-9 3-methyltransferase [Hymenobacter gelipurpurascens]
MQKITTFLTFNDKAKEAATLYTSLFKGSKITSVTNLPNGSVMTVEFELAGQKYIAMNGGPRFTFSTGISLAVSCADQAEIDELWDKLTANGGEPGQCGWLKDPFGVSWQIIPTNMGQLLRSDDPARAQRKMAAMLQMQKIDIATLEQA